jgi:hypothetical protein
VCWKCQAPGRSWALEAQPPAPSSETGCKVAKERLTVVRSRLSLDEIAHALRILQPDAMEKFRDARVTNWFAEIWGETLFGFRRHPSSNYPGSDARLALGPIGRFDISVRCFNRGYLKFQDSKYIGMGRKATLDDSRSFCVPAQSAQMPRSASTPVPARSAPRIRCGSRYACCP